MTLRRKGYAGFDIETTRCDQTRAGLAVRGDLDRSAASVLARIIDDHVRAGRRFVQLNLAAVGDVCPASIDVLTRAHERLLANRGTLILTGVAAPLEAMLRAAVPHRPLFVLAPTAADQQMSGPQMSGPLLTA